MATAGPKKKKSRPSKVTHEERQLAQEAWMQVENNYVVISKSLFSKLFTRHPEFREFFKNFFIDGGAADSWINPRFEKHMIQVLMPALGDIVRTIDDPNALTNMMITLAQIHKEKDLKIAKKHVEILKDTFMEALREQLGDCILPQHQAALYKVIGIALYIFEDNL